jgi:hypothetical protein
MNLGFFNNLQSFLYEQIKEYDDTSIETDDLSCMIKKYNHINVHQKRVLLEKLLKRSIPYAAFKRLKLPEYAFPRMNRGIPISYKKENDRDIYLINYFADIKSLKKQLIDKSVSCLYSNCSSNRVTVTVFSQVYPDGFGDFFAQLKSADILLAMNIKVNLVTIISNTQKIPNVDHKYEIYIINNPKDKTDALHFSEFSDEVKKVLFETDIILQLPTYYRYTEELIKYLKKNRKRPFKFISLGEYGFLSTDHFSPISFNRSMGLHFLEKGIFIDNKRKYPFSFIENIDHKVLKTILFKNMESINDFKKYRRLFLGYLSSSNGYFVYLLSLLKYLEEDSKDIYVCFVNLGPLFKIFSSEEKFNMLKKYNIKKVKICIENGINEISINNDGKTLVLVELDNISHKDFNILMTVSEDYIGVKGNQSISEAISYDKVFLYNGPYHTISFIKDLIALSRKTLDKDSSTCKLIDLFYSLLEYQEDNEGNNELVEDKYFAKDEDIDYEDMAEKIGVLLQDPATYRGFKKLNLFIKKNYDVSLFIDTLIKRTATHLKYPNIEKQENDLLDKFADNKISFENTILNLRRILCQQMT